MSDDPTYRPQGLRIFLSYSRKDQTEVKKLFHRLQDDGFSPWLDINALASGVDWKEAINQGMKDADAVLVCLSAGVKMGVGYVSKEIEHALDLAANKPQGTIFVIPVRMAPCKVPKRLATPNAADWHLPGGYEKLAADLREKAMWDRPAAAIPAWDRILERNPRDLEAQLKRGLALGYAGDWRKAIDSFNLLLKTHPTFAPAWAARAQAYAALAENSNAVMRSARALAAIQDLNRAIEFEPGNAQFFFQRGNCSLNLLNAAKSAISDYDRALKIDPEFADAWEARGILLNGKGQHKGAISDLTRAISLNAESYRAYLWRGQSSYEQQQYQLALKDLNEAIRLDPEGSYAYRFRSDVHRKLGNKEQARADLAASEQFGYDG